MHNGHVWSAHAPCARATYSKHASLLQDVDFYSSNMQYESSDRAGINKILRAKVKKCVSLYALTEEIYLSVRLFPSVCLEAVGPKRHHRSTMKICREGPSTVQCSDNPQSDYYTVLLKLHPRPFLKKCSVDKGLLTASMLPLSKALFLSVLQWSLLAKTAAWQL